jgi:hypothetical protein
MVLILAVSPLSAANTSIYDPGHPCRAWSTCCFSVYRLWLCIDKMLTANIFLTAFSTLPLTIYLQKSVLCLDD